MMQKDKQMTEIRNATVNELDFCTELETNTFSEPWSKNAFLQCIDSEDSYFNIAFINNKPVGYYVAGNICNEINLYTIAVSPEHRKCGIGKAMLQHLIQSAKKDDAYFIGLEVRESNTYAIRLYESEGFICNGKRKNFYKKPTEDALLYTLYFKEENT